MSAGHAVVCFPAPRLRGDGIACAIGAPIWREMVQRERIETCGKYGRHGKAPAAAWRKTPRLR
jgi:hypothetical protein